MTNYRDAEAFTGSATCASEAETAFDQQYVLRVLATSDLHGHIRSFDYSAGVVDPDLGLEAALRTIAALRRTADNSILVDAGDFLFGSPLGDLASDSGWVGAHPGVVAMNALGYDAVGLGNHDFDFGTAALVRALTDAEFPVVATNISADDGPVPRCRRSVILNRTLRDATGRLAHVRIGIVSVMPASLLAQTALDHADVAALRVVDAVAEAADRVAHLRQSGADVVIAICHGGLSSGDPAVEAAPRMLARVPGIDAIVMGHQHGVFPHPAPVATGVDVWAHLTGDVDAQRGRVGWVPAVMPGCWGRHVGAIDLNLRRAPDGDWRVVGAVSRVRSVTDTDVTPVDAPAIQRLRRLTGAAHNRARGRASRVIGVLPRPATSYFARLGLCPFTMLTAEVMAETVRRQMPDRGTLPVIGFAAPYRAGGLGGPQNYLEIDEGPLRAGHVDAMFPFPDRICAVEVTGAHLYAWMERTARGFIPPGEGPDLDGPLIDATIPSLDFHLSPHLLAFLDLRPVCDDLSDLGDRRIGRRRVRRLFHLGRPVDPKASYLIAVSDYRADGGGAFPGCHAANLRWRSEVTVRDALLAHAGAAVGEDLWRPGLSFRFDPTARPLFLTGPGAARHAQMMQLAHLQPEPDRRSDWLQCRVEPGLGSLDFGSDRGYLNIREVGAGRHLANPVRSGRKQP